MRKTEIQKTLQARLGCPLMGLVAVGCIQLGFAHAEAKAPSLEYTPMAKVLQNVIDVRPMRQSTYALLGDGRLVAWGANDSGQLAAGFASTFSVSPVNVRLPGPLDSLLGNGSCGHVAGTPKTQIWCWNLFDGSNLPVKVETPEEVESLHWFDVHDLRAVIVTRSGNLYSSRGLAAGEPWVWNSTPDLVKEFIEVLVLKNGQMFDVSFSQTDPMPFLKPVLDSPTKVKHVYVGPSASLITCVSGPAGSREGLWCGGVYGAAGLGSTIHPGPRFIHVLEADSILDVKSGGPNTCALVTESSENHVYCWGENENGEVGNGTLLPTSRPSLVSFPEEISKIYVGEAFAFAVSVTNRLWGWGYNQSGGFLGQGDRVDRVLPTEIDFGAPMKDFQFGYYHFCGVSKLGLAKCWGFNDYAESGQGFASFNIGSMEHVRDVPWIDL